MARKCRKPKESVNPIRLKWQGVGEDEIGNDRRSGETIVKINPELVRENEVKLLCGSSAKLVDLIGSLNEIPLQETLLWMYQAGHK